MGQAAYDWLSRGLFESIVGFIREARDGHFALKGAFYEFQWDGVLTELRAALDRRSRSASCSTTSTIRRGRTGTTRTRSPATG